MEEVMSEHYFSRDPESAERPRVLDFAAGGVSLKLKSDAGVFSAGRVDFGSELLIKTLLTVRLWTGARVLDIGCGYGVIGLSLAKAGADAVMCDINERALQLCRDNICLNSSAAVCVSADCGEGIEGEFDAVVTNPPIRAGKNTVCRFLTMRMRCCGIRANCLLLFESSRARRVQKNIFRSASARVK